MKRAVGVVGLWVASVSVGLAAQISEFIPKQGVPADDGIRVVFDADVSPFGDPQASAPLAISCGDPDVAGAGRWIDSRNWTWQFAQAPGPGVQCVATVSPSFHDTGGKPLQGSARFTFSTGAPRIVSSRPYGSTIDEDQAFVLQFNGPVATASVERHSHCIVEGLGEAVPVHLVQGQARKDILAAAYYADVPKDASAQVLQCARRLPAEAKVQLRVGPGILAERDRKESLPTRKAETFDYQVRPAFTATVSCLRENASSACTPVAPLTLQFSAPVAFETAIRARLETPAGERQPVRPEGEDTVQSLRFDGPFPESATLTFRLPADLKDDAGRAPSNRSDFPLTVKTADNPPLVKFAAAPFGVIERFANVPPTGSEADAPATVPVTLRNVEANLITHALSESAGQVADHRPQDDADVLRWYAKVRRLEQGRWTPAQLQDIMAGRAPRNDRSDGVDVRGFSVLKNIAAARRLTLPGAGDKGLRPFEVIGVPVPEPGFHVLEIESPRLGQSLLEDRGPMYVRSTALVTNLAVHIKRGRDDLLAWVTTLDDGKVVPHARVAVLDCSGRLLARGTTDADGIWHRMGAVKAPDYCEDTGLSGLYVSARIDADHPLARGRADFAFALSEWNGGIESWRFNVPTETSVEPTVVAHTVFDRTLFRAGETVSMKHFLRTQTRAGLSVPASAFALPDRLIIEHEGSGEQYEMDVAWTHTPSGGLSAAGTYAIPPHAKLGRYQVRLTDADHRWYGAGTFRVEEFKLPLLGGSMQVADAEGRRSLIAPRALQVDLQLNFLSGGPAGRLPVSLSGVARQRWLRFDGYEGFSFNPLRRGTGGPPDQDAGQEAAQTLFLDKKRVELDAQGSARAGVDSLPRIDMPTDLTLEASFADPNGEIQTLSSTVPAWPAAVVPGIRTEGWLAAGSRAPITAVALDTAGKPLADAQLEVRAVAHRTVSTRKRLVGGFYSYDNRSESRDLGTVCKGSTDKQGLLHCRPQLDTPGEIELIVRAVDGQGHEARASTTVWLVGRDETWFGGQNDDRIDVVPARKRWRPGEQAEFQVRMPFREATALVAVEREGVLETHVVTLHGNDPGFALPVREEWGPNVYVSVLALRGRLRDVPWMALIQADDAEQRRAAVSEAVAAVSPPSAFVDLAKPTFRFGMAEIQVSDTQDQLQVHVEADRPTYAPRDTAEVAIRVTLPDGSPAAHGTVAFAAVDRALLELAPNDTWDLLAAMRQRHGYGVDTATSQLEVVGRRHYGRKAVPAGGGGGKSPTRELLDTLLLWKASVPLDEDGRARLSVPLQDAITRYEFVAIADYGAMRFGTGTTSVATALDLQAISGLPAVVREGDQYTALVTVRNATQRDMTVSVRLQPRSGGGDAAVPARRVDLPAGTARSVSWSLTAPLLGGEDDEARLDWIVSATEDSGAQGADVAAPAGDVQATTRPASDRLAVSQRLLAATPLTVRQASLLHLDSGAPVSVAVEAPASGIRDREGQARGGLRLSLQSSLAGGLPGVTQWFERYPYTCLEQLSSRSIGLDDQAAWKELMQRLPGYLDKDGLAAYFPGGGQGSEVLTAWLLSASAEASGQGRAFPIPEAARQAMASALVSFLDGRLTRRSWAPRRDMTERRLMAMEALSRQGQVRPAMWQGMKIDPQSWPTSAVLDWIAILQRTPAASHRGQYLQEALGVLRARLRRSGSQAHFEDGDAPRPAWWLMSSPETDLAKAILVLRDDAAWRSDLPAMLQGLLGMQQRGAWRTTTANLLGTLAVHGFAQRFETEPVQGSVRAQWDGQASTTLAWQSAVEKSGVRTLEMFTPWSTAGGATTLTLEQQGRGGPWASLQALAAVAPAVPIDAGYAIERELVPVNRQTADQWTRGDIYRVRLTIRARQAMTWVALTDPVPAGASILGSGLGRDSTIATADRDPTLRLPTFVERSFAAYRAYFDYLPAGTSTVQYTVRLNTEGRFQLPPTRIEALYAPDVNGERPNPDGMTVVSAPQ